jgi:hypothetical protein
VSRSDNVSYETVGTCRWRRTFLTGKEIIKYSAISGRPVAVTGRTNISK